MNHLILNPLRRSVWPSRTHRGRHAACRRLFALPDAIRLAVMGVVSEAVV